MLRPGVDPWCDRHGVARGDAQPLGRIRDFARVRYGGHPRPDREHWSVNEARDVFARFGLSHHVRDMASNRDRF
jgi:hypothetical protein